MDKPTIFISDLHLDPSRPAVTGLFLRFLEAQREQAKALYILGDLFEAWIGDDAVPADHPVLAGLRRFAERAPLFVMHGNRDFLLGERFAETSGATLLADPSVVDLYGTPTLVMHGDSLCTDDRDYQQFRAMVRNPAWQQAFLAMSVPERLNMAKQARSESSSRNSALDDYLMDVNADAVAAAFRQHGVGRIIHGHTHRPAIHDLTVDDRPCQRIVLGDWYDQGSALFVHPDRIELRGLPLPG